ncbi:MAG TPA: hypothetical protein VIZ90_00950 [Rhizobiaceae bacterium]
MPEMSGLSEFVAAAGTIVAAFFLLSLAVETILENFRGILALAGIEALKSKMTMDAALAEVAEFVPPESKEAARFAGLAQFVKTSSISIIETKETCERIVAELAHAVSPGEKNAIIEREKLWLAAAAAPIRAAMQKSEEKRVFALRIISAALGIVVAWASGLNVLDITGTQVSPAGDYAFLGYVLGGLAAAGGSSFWHDQLDRVRSVKQIGQQLASVAKAPGS